MTENFFCAVGEVYCESPIDSDNFHHRVSHWQSSGKTEIEWLWIPKGKVLKFQELNREITKKSQAGCFVTYLLDIDDNDWEKATKGRRWNSFLVKRDANFELVPVVPSKVTFTISSPRSEKSSSTWKILCEVSEVELGIKIPPVNKIEIISDSINKHRRYLELLKFGNKFVIAGLNEDRVAFNLQNQEGLTLLIHDYDGLQGERINLWPASDTDQQSEIKFIVEEIHLFSDNDRRFIIKAQEGFEWKGERINLVTLILPPSMEKEQWLGRTVVIKNPLLVKKSNSSLDIGFSYRGEDGELNSEYGYEAVEIPGKAIDRAGKVFLTIGVVAVILSFISSLTKTRNSESKKGRLRKIRYYK